MNWQPSFLLIVALVAIPVAQAIPTSQATAKLQANNSSQAPAVETEKSTIVASVGKQTITQADVLRHVQRTVGPTVQGESNPEGRKKGAAENLIPKAALRIAADHLVNRELALQFLAENGFAAGKNEISLRADLMKQNLAKTGQKMDDYLKKNGLTADQLRHAVAWEIGWKKYAKNKLPEAELRKYFEANRKAFDGTQLRVAHILWRPTNENRKDMFAMAVQVRTQIVERKLSWEQAVKDHSIAESSKENGGELGWIHIDQPMPDVFSVAAFNLEVNQISQPITTAFGMHLIKCLEIKPGAKPFEEVMSQVRNKATTELFLNAASQQREKTEIKFFDR